MELEQLKANVKKHQVILADGTEIPAVGQGTWHMGENRSKRSDEIEALRTGLDAGMKVIDTAEMYGSGKSEKLVGEAIEGRRDDVFLVSKVLPSNADRQGVIDACNRSLERLGTDYLDLYLLHWRGGTPLRETVAGLEQLVSEGKIKRWGVSNFDTADMEELYGVENGRNCAVNQVLYHLDSRGIEYDLLPWLADQKMPIMAYCPLAQGNRQKILNNDTVKQLAEKHDLSPLQIALAWTIRDGNVLSIPKAGQAEHVLDNAKAAEVEFSDDDLAQLDKVFPAPTSKQPLDIV